MKITLLLSAGLALLVEPSGLETAVAQSNQAAYVFTSFRGNGDGLHLAWSRDGVHFTRYGREPVVDLGTKFDTKGAYVAPRATPGDEPNTWWFYYSGTNVEHDSNPKDINSDGGFGRFLLVLE